MLSLLFATFIKIGENNSTHEFLRMHQPIYIFIFNDLHLQTIETISPKTSVDNSSAQWAIFFQSGAGIHMSHNIYHFLLKAIVMSNTPQNCH